MDRDLALVSVYTCSATDISHVEETITKVKDEIVTVLRIISLYVHVYILTFQLTILCTKGKRKWNVLHSSP